MAFAQAYKSAPSHTPIEYHELIIDLQDKLKSQGFSLRVEYGGSAFKGTRIDSSDYDNLFVKRDDSVLAYPNVLHPERAMLKNQYGITLNPKTERNEFQGAVQRALNILSLQDKTKVHDNAGISFYSGSWRTGEKPLFAVDLVFCYDVANEQGNRKIYAAMPGKSTGEEALLWWLVTDVEEKTKMNRIDQGHGIGRWAVRILKAVKGQEATLKVFKSCLFEHVLYYLKDEHPGTDFWLESNLKEVIKAMLMYLIQAVRRGKLMHYFSHTENLMPVMSDITKSNVLNRLENLSKDSRIQQLINDV